MISETQNGAFAAITLYAKQKSPTFEAKLQTSLELLQQARQTHTQQGANRINSIAQASSLGAEDMVVTELLHRSGLNCPIFILDTGKLHPETLTLLERAKAHYQRPISVFQPNAKAIKAFEAKHGNDAMHQSVDLRKACCHIRKMEPLERAIKGKTAWITGLRQEQSNTRAQVALQEQELLPSGLTRTKINPLAFWTWGDVWYFIEQAHIPYNPMHDRFFPSVGCIPCTRAIGVGEEFRSGRWWWEQDSTKECGLHTAKASALA